jgi:hypothetical protein
MDDRVDGLVVDARKGDVMDSSDPNNSAATAQEERERRNRQRQDELVDLASEQSFPASDPPSYWAGTTSDDDER